MRIIKVSIFFNGLVLKNCRKRIVKFVYFVYFLVGFKVKFKIVLILKMKRNGRRREVDEIMRFWVFIGRRGRCIDWFCAGEGTIGD